MKVIEVKNLRCGYGFVEVVHNVSFTVGEGEILYTTSENVTKIDISKFLNLMKHAGQLTGTAEELMDAGCSVSGCGPAFVFKFIRGLAQGGIDAGLDRETALALAVQTVKGSAKLLEDSHKDIDALIDSICSPGGSTIEGVKVLEEKGMEQTVTDAVAASYKRNIELGKA